jgi:hypothetical protein
MTTTGIEKLLEKYYDGLTTLTEERELKAFFSGDDVPAHLQEHVSQFRYSYRAAEEELTDPRFEEKFFGKVEPKTISIVPRSMTRLYFALSAAASILLLVGLFFTFKSEFESKPRLTHTLSANELSFIQSRDILLRVSLSFNKGVDQMHHFEQFDHAMEKVQAISKFYQYETLIINPEPMESRVLKSKNQ